jgi:voltage-gated potassium channel
MSWSLTGVLEVVWPVRVTMVRESGLPLDVPRADGDNPPVRRFRDEWAILGRFKLPLGMLGVAIVYGVVGYVVLFGWSLINAIYMTGITLTTVGYREVEPVETAGEKLFTISVLVVGLAAVFTGIGVLANMIGDGELTQINRRRRVRRQVSGLRDHYIVCAFGRVGRAVVAELRRQGAPILVLDTDPGLEERLIADGVPHMIADPSEESVLREAGVERARGLICAVDSDEVNVYITLTARALNPRLTIVARASRRQTRQALENAGADHVISPYTLSGHRMAALSVRPGLLDFIEMVTVGPDLRLDEIEVRDGSPLVGVTIDAACARREGVTILAHTRRTAAALAAPPDGGTVLEPGDLLVAFGSRGALESLEG